MEGVLFNKQLEAVFVNAMIALCLYKHDFIFCLFISLAEELFAKVAHIRIHAHSKGIFLMLQFFHYFPTFWRRNLLGRLVNILRRGLLLGEWVLLLPVGLLN
jgi:hypothetical protein